MKPFPHTTTALRTLLTPDRGHGDVGVLTRQVSVLQQGVQELNSVLTLSTWGQHPIPQVEGSAPQDKALSVLDSKHPINVLCY